MAVSETGGWIDTGRIKFDKEEIDVSNNFDPSTGVFEASDMLLKCPSKYTDEEIKIKGEQS